MHCGKERACDDDTEHAQRVVNVRAHLEVRPIWKPVCSRTSSKYRSSTGCVKPGMLTTEEVLPLAPYISTFILYF